MIGRARGVPSLQPSRDPKPPSARNARALRNVLGIAAVVVAVHTMLVGLGAWQAEREASATSLDMLAFVSDSVRARADTYVSPTRTTAHAAAYAIANENLEVETDRLPAILYRHLLRAPQLSGIHVVAPDGVSVEVWRDGEGYISRVMGQGLHPFDVTRTHAATFQQLSEKETFGAGDPRADDIYLDSLDTTVPTWTDPYASPVTGLATVSVAEVARSNTNTTLAVVWVDLGLDGLDQALAEVPLGVDGVAAVLDARGAVVATSRDVGAASATPQFGVPAGEAGLETGEALGAGEDRRVFAASASVQVEQLRLKSPGGPDWVVHVQANPDTLAAGMSGFSRLLGWLAVGSVVVVTLGVVVGWWMTRPLRELTRRATRDGLTGLCNRTEAMMRGADAVALAGRSDAVAIVLLCDLDNFKLINDTRGHSAGDSALVAVARALEREVRAGDVVGRWGGDEFIAVITLPSSADTRRVVERVREHVELELRRAVGDGLDVGITVGYAESTAFTGGIQTLLDAADVALIQGKKRAKSMVYAAASPGSGQALRSSSRARRGGGAAAASARQEQGPMRDRRPC